MKQPNLSTQALKDFQLHVIQQYPKEACGLIRDGEFVACTNIAPNPTDAFKISSVELMEPYEAILHSHPYQLGDDSFKLKNNPAWPSSRDVEMFNKGTVPWGIVCTDGEGVSDVVWMFETLDQPVLGRDFVHGVFDCYATVRDWYYQNHNLKLPNYPRQYDWWNAGQSLYMQYFEEAGFYEITEEEADVGDSVLMQVMSPVPNHAAVISGNNEITHHLFHRLSETDRLNKWKKVIVKYLRNDNVKKN